MERKTWSFALVSVAVSVKVIGGVAHLKGKVQPSEAVGDLGESVNQGPLPFRRRLIPLLHENLHEDFEVSLFPGRGFHKFS